MTFPETLYVIDVGGGNWAVSENPVDPATPPMKSKWLADEIVRRYNEFPGAGPSVHVAAPEDDDE